MSDLQSERPEAFERPGEPRPPAQPEPFASEPVTPARGCSRPVLLGCGAAVVLTAVLVIGFFWKLGDLFRWSLEQFEAQISQALPEDLTAAERERLAAAFDAAADAVQEGTADPAALQRLQGRLLAAVGSDRLTREEALDLIESLEAVAGIEGGESPAPEEPRPPPDSRSVALLPWPPAS